MSKVNVFEAKARLSEYLDRAASGERIVICRHNKPVAELRPVEETRTQERPLGPLPGRPTFEVPASFFEPLSDDELDAWEGSDRTDLLGYATHVPDAAKVAEGSSSPKPARRPRRKRS